MAIEFFDPRIYGGADNRLASGDIPFALPGPIGFVSASPSNLYLHRKGLSSVTAPLVTRVNSATEIVSQQNEVLVIKDKETGGEVTAIDVGASVEQGARQLLVLPAAPDPNKSATAATQPITLAARAQKQAAISAQQAKYDPYDYSDNPQSISAADYLLGVVTAQHRIVSQNQAPTVENTNPSGGGTVTSGNSGGSAPSTYVLPSGGSVSSSTSFNYTYDQISAIGGGGGYSVPTTWNNPDQQQQQQSSVDETTLLQQMGYL